MPFSNTRSAVIREIWCNRRIAEASIIGQALQQQGVYDQNSRLIVSRRVYALGSSLMANLSARTQVRPVESPFGTCI